MTGSRVQEIVTLEGELQAYLSEASLLEMLFFSRKNRVRP